MNGCILFPVAFKHTGKWRRYAGLINKLLPHYSIKTHTSYEEKGVMDNRAAPTYRYILKCDSCGREVRRQKICAVVEHPEHYRCMCGGKLKRIM